MTAKEETALTVNGLNGLMMILKHAPKAGTPV